VTKPTPLAIAAAGLGAASLLAGCSSSSDTTTTTAAPATTTAPATTAPATTAKPATTAAGAAATLPAAPSGSTELQNTTANGVVYQRWSNSGATPQQIVTDYQTALEAEGYTVTNTGGGGGGWGKWGGAGAGLTGNKGTTYVDVQAGGQTGQPVFFEVCQGANQRAVDDCENLSEGPQQNQNNDSNSNAS
jgi:hypothetical protein